uniref:BRO1 domain-containing protein n=1 Tax=Tetradesmus obliquus TaxID=3088 RepID=A0A383VYS6_TETOB|eukprot:jgi/Sobl393_1/13459/SZX70003.1
MEEAVPPAPAPPVPPLLPFDDPWQIRTQSCTFEDLATAGEVVSLNHIRDMSGQRNISLVREGTKFACSPDQVDGFKKYLSNLAILIDQEGERFDLDFEWSSPLSGRAGRFFRLNGLKKEQGLATFLYASLLRQLGHQGVQDMLGLSPGSTALPADSEAAATVLAAAATQLRQAAGVYDYLAEVMLPPLFASLKGDRPAEIMARLSSVMCQLCLAEAQALTAFRAGQRASSSGSLVASLHCGAAELYEKAAKVIRDYIGDFTIASDRLRRYIAIGSSLATARAHKVMASELLAKSEAGQAERSCLDAQQLLGVAMNAADIDGAWRAVLQQELADVERIKKPIESDRLIVYCQPLPREANPLPAAKVLVSLVPYQLEKTSSTTAELAMQL